MKLRTPHKEIEATPIMVCIFRECRTVRVTINPDASGVGDGYVLPLLPEWDGLSDEVLIHTVCDALIPTMPNMRGDLAFLPSIAPPEFDIPELANSDGMEQPN